MLKQIRWKRLLLQCFVIHSVFTLPAYLYVAYKDFPKEDHYCYSNSDQTPFGSDFIAFYSAFSLLRESPTEIYNYRAQYKKQKSILGANCEKYAQGMPFIYPPIVPYVFSWLAKLKYSHAFITWSILGALCAFTGLVLAMKGSPLKKASIPLCIVCLGSPAFIFYTLLGGQLSWLGILLTGSLYIALTAKKFFLAGLLLCLSAYKPPLFLILGAILCITQNKRFNSGVILGTAIAIVVSISLLGAEGFLSYLKHASNYTYGETLDYQSGKSVSDVDLLDQFLPIDKGRGVYSLVMRSSFLFSHLQATRILYMFLVFACIIFISREFIKVKDRTSNCEALDHFYPGIVICSVALSIQCIVYDLAILLVPLVICTKRAARPIDYPIILSVLVLPIAELLKFRDQGLISAVLLGIIILRLLYLMRAEHYFKSNSDQLRNIENA